MFGRAPRFPPEKPSEVPGPNHYKIPEQENWDSYKRGAFLEKADRFGKDPVYEGPDSIPSTSEQPISTKDASAAGKRVEGPPNVASLRQQIEALKSQNAKLERLYELDSKRFQEQASSDKARIESLAKQATLLDSQLTSAQKANAELKRDHDRAVDRERVMKVKLERLESGNRDETDRNVKYVALRKELDELRKLHEDEKKMYRSENQQLKTDLEKHRKATADQQAAAKKQVDNAESKVQEGKKALSAAQSEINDLRQKLRTLERERVPVSEIDQLKKTMVNAESSKRERDAKVAELERTLRMETKKKEAIEEQVKEMKEKSLTLAEELKAAQGTLKATEMERTELAKQLEEALSTISGHKEGLHGDLLAIQAEADNMKILLQDCAKEYGTLATSSVPQSRLEDEQARRTELQSRFIKLERRLQDKEAQVQELAIYLRYKAEQQELLLQSLQSAEEELTYLRSLRLEADNEGRALNKEEIVPSWDELDGLALKTALAEGGRAYQIALEEYHREWLDILVKECKAADNAAVSLGAALNAVLERTSEMDGQLQVTRVEAESARKRAKETDEEVGALKLEMGNLRGQYDSKVTELMNENQIMLGEIAEARRKFEDGKKRLDKAEMQLREKTAAEKALADDVEGLSEALQDAMKWEQAYKRLSEEVDALVQRNELVEREADHLSRFNAEILGHTNPNQKIHYLDRIRRDLADAKQKLAISTRQREAVLEDNDTLRNELHAYRSLSQSTTKGGNGMTRVTRVPLGMSTTNESSPSDHGRDSLPKVPEDQTLVPSRNGPMTLDELM